MQCAACAMWRTAVEFEIEPPLNVTAPSDMATTPPSCVQPTQPRLLQSAAHPVRRHPLQLRIRPDLHAPLLRCRISPRRRTARCPWPCGARRRWTAHERIAPPLGQPQKPALRPIEQRTRSTRHAHHTAVRCGEGASPMQHATHKDATCNTRRCNMQHTQMLHADASRCNAPRAPMHYATCNVRHALLQRATRTDAPMQRRCADATPIDATC